MLKLLMAFWVCKQHHGRMPLLLRDIWPIEALREHKVHFARWNQHNQPLDVFARDRQEWQGWQEYKPGRNEFNRPYIFSLIQFYHETDSWLFGGIYEVTARHDDRYEVILKDDGAEMIGRLKLHYPYRARTTRPVMEAHYDTFVVQEILKEPYSGRSFPGFDEIDLSFEELESLVRNNRDDWRISLASVKGIYLITDTNTGRRYVGSAYGDQGIWGRWCQYAENGHGNNVELRRIADDPDLAYARANFRFALLEHRLDRTPDDMILARETYWKRILLTRGEQGLNRN